MPLPKGVTSRQLNYWIQEGYISPEHGASTAPGRGNRRQFSQFDLDVITAMARLREKGFEAKLASIIAHKLARERQLNFGPEEIGFHLGDGVSVTIMYTPFTADD